VDGGDAWVAEVGRDDDSASPEVHLAMDTLTNYVGQNPLVFASNHLFQWDNKKGRFHAL
jgi:hypothetical protein